MVLPPVAVVAVFIGFPVGAAIAYTLGKTGGPNSIVASIAQRQHVAKHGVTTAAYREVLGNSHVRADLRATIWVTLVTIVVVVLLSWSIALYLRLTDTWIARVVSALSVIPLFIPVVIASYAILTFYAATGFMRTLAYHIGWHSFPTLGYTLWAVVIAEIWVNVPFGVLMMSSGLNSVPNALIEAARHLRPRQLHRPLPDRPLGAELDGRLDAAVLRLVQPAAAGRGDGHDRVRPRRRHRDDLRLGERPRREARVLQHMSAFAPPGVARGDL